MQVGQHQKALAQVDICANLPAAGVLGLNASSVQVIEIPDIGEVGWHEEVKS